MLSLCEGDGGLSKRARFFAAKLNRPRVIADRVRTSPSTVPWVGGRETVAETILSQLSKTSFLPSHRIGDRVAEHVEKGGLEEGVELGEGLAALGPQGVRRIQNPRNPLLLVEGREGDLEFQSPLVVEIRDVRRLVPERA